MSKHYVTSSPCPRGHMAKRFKSTRGCVECNRENAKKKYAKNELKILKCHPDDYEQLRALKLALELDRA